MIRLYNKKPIRGREGGGRMNEGRRYHLGGADGFAQLARDAAFLPGRVATQRVLSSETRPQRSLLERIIDRRRLHEDVARHDTHTLNCTHYNHL